MTTGSNSIILEQIAEFLDRFFAVERYSQEERGGVYLPSTRPVRRLGLVLEPSAQLQEWVRSQNLAGNRRSPTSDLYSGSVG